MRTFKRSILFLTLSLPFLVAACDSTDQVSTADYASVLTCQPGTFRLVGTLDGTSVDLTEDTSGGGYGQDGKGGEFGTQNNTPEVDPARTDLDLTWTPSLSDGDVGVATGTLKLPGATAASAPLCLGVGTSVRSVSSGLQFRLAGLTSGASCDVPHTGTLQGCWGG